MDDVLNGSIVGKMEDIEQVCGYGGLELWSCFVIFTDLRLRKVVEIPETSCYDSISLEK